MATQKQLAGVETKFLVKSTHWHLPNLVEAYTARNENYERKE